MTKEFNINDFQINKNYVIEASAGCGKTYNIVEMVKVITNNYSLDNVLIVTFTNKASLELKERILKNIKTDINKLHVHTFHSFCREALACNNISTNNYLSSNLVDKEQIIRYIKQFLRESKIKDELLLLIENNFDINGIEDYFYEVLNKYYLENGQINENVISFKKEESHIKYVFKMLGKKHFNDVLDDEIVSHYYNLKANEKCEEFVDVLDSSYLKDFIFNGKKFKSSSKVFKDVIEDFEFYKKIKESVANKEYYHYLIYKYIDEAYQYINDFKYRNKQYEFSDLINSFYCAIKNNEGLVNSLKKQYRYVIIDEFQDTNYLQFSIFKQIFLSDVQHNMIVVGDPKQSIFSFQGTDVIEYNKAKEEILKKGELLTLSYNYRSNGKLINTFNQIFKDDKFFGEKFIETKHKKDLKISYKNKSIDNFLVIGNDEISEKDFVYKTTNLILDFCTYNGESTNMQLQARNTSFDDIAILVRNRNQADAFIRLFKKLSIPYMLSKDESLFQSHECHTLLIVLKCLSDINVIYNQQNLNKLLYSDFFGYDLLDLKYHRYKQSDISLIYELLRLIENKKWTLLLNKLVSTNYYQDNIVKNVASFGIYKQLFEITLGILYKYNSIDKVVLKIKGYQKGILDDDIQEVLEKNHNIPAITIMTMHSSKGLQFPIVINASTPLKKNNSNSKVFVFHEDNKAKISFNEKDQENETIQELKRLYYVCLTRAEFMFITPYYNYDKKLSFLSAIYDKEVCFKDFETLNFSKLKEQVENIKKHLIIKEDICKIKQLNTNDFKTNKHSYSSLSHNEEIIENEFVDLENEVKASYMVFDNKVDAIKLNYKAEAKALALSKDFPKGNKIGSCLHDIIETISFSNYSFNLNDIIEDKIKQYHLSSNIKQDIELIIETLMNIEIPTINNNIKLLSLKDENIIKEVEFSFNIKDERLKNYLNGFIDMLFIHEDKYYIVDWKSDSKITSDDNINGFGCFDALKQYVDEHFAIQRVIYSYCLIKILKEKYQDESYELTYNQRFGGIFYIFLRGINLKNHNGIYYKKWNCFKDIEDSFNEIVNVKVK